MKIEVREVETGKGLRKRVCFVKGDEVTILRDGGGAGLFETEEQVDLVSEFWEERKKRFLRK